MYHTIMLIIEEGNWVQAIWNSLLHSQFFCKPKTLIKKWSLFKLKNHCLGKKLNEENLKTQEYTSIHSISQQSNDITFHAVLGKKCTIHSGEWETKQITSSTTVLLQKQLRPHRLSEKILSSKVLGTHWENLQT